jgi:hypothetical protein
MATFGCMATPLPNVAQKGTGYASLWALVYVSSPMCYRRSGLQKPSIIDRPALACVSPIPACQARYTQARPSPPISNPQCHGPRQPYLTVAQYCWGSRVVSGVTHLLPLGQRWNPRPHCIALPDRTRLIAPLLNPLTSSMYTMLCCNPPSLSPLLMGSSQDQLLLPCMCPCGPLPSLYSIH